MFAVIQEVETKKHLKAMQNHWKCMKDALL